MRLHSAGSQPLSRRCPKLHRSSGPAGDTQDAAARFPTSSPALHLRLWGIAWLEELLGSIEISCRIKLPERAVQWRLQTSTNISAPMTHKIAAYSRIRFDSASVSPGLTSAGAELKRIREY